MTTKALLEKELRKARKARDAYHLQFLELRKAVEAIYYAAYWHADRDVDEVGLWTALRDAAQLPPGATYVLGEDRSK